MLLNEVLVLKISDLNDFFFEKLKIELDIIIETKFCEYLDQKDEKVKLTICNIKNIITSATFKKNHLYIFRCVFDKKLLTDESYRVFNILVFFQIKNDC